MSNSHSVADLSCGGTTRRFYFRGATSDEQVAKDVFQQQEYSLNRLRRASELIEFVKEQERRGRRPLIVDAGANIGATALYFMLTFPNSSVVAVEPDHENYNLLSKNTQGLRVKAHHAAVSATKGRVSVFDPGERSEERRVGKECRFRLARSCAIIRRELNCTRVAAD